MGSSPEVHTKERGLQHVTLDPEVRESLLARLHEQYGPKSEGSSEDKSDHATHKPDPEAAKKEQMMAVDGGSTQQTANAGQPHSLALVLSSRPQTHIDNTAPAGKESKVALGVESSAKGEHNTSMVRHKIHLGAPEVRSGIEHIMTVAKGYCVSFHQKDDEGHKVQFEALREERPDTWNYLLSLLNDEHADGHLSHLLGVEKYRPFIVMRILLDYLYKKLISPNVFRGFSPDIDDKLTSLRNQMIAFNAKKSETDQQERQKVVNEHAKVVAFILQHPRMKSFQESLTTHHSQVLHTILEPMQSESVTPEASISALRFLVSISLEMSFKTWSSGMTLHFTFPDVGFKFALATMEACNGPQFARNPEELQKMQARISFVVSPVLTLRDERDPARLACYGIKRCMVLVMR